jgi:membrane protein
VAHPEQTRPSDRRRARHTIAKGLEVVRDAIRGFLDHDGAMLSAGLSFYAIVSLAPLTVLVVILGGIFFERDDVRVAVIEEARRFMGTEAAGAFAEVAERAEEPVLGSAAALVGVLAFVFGATSFFAQMQTALNRVWGVTSDDDTVRESIWLFARKRLVSLLMVATIATLLVAWLIVSGAFGVLSQWLIGWTSFERLAAQGVDTMLSVAAVTILFAGVFRLLPDARLEWRDVWFGAGLASILFAVGKLGLTLYLGESNVGSAYGAAGSVVVLLVWIYYSCIFFLFGAEICRVRAKRRGRELVIRRAFVRKRAPHDRGTERFTRSPEGVRQSRTGTPPDAPERP